MNQQKITIIGTGYVGLVSGVCLAEIGHHVTCIDTNDEKINSLKKGIVPIYEPGLNQLIQDNIHANRLRFSTNLSEHIIGQDAIFIAVGTPTALDGISADLQYVFKVAHDIAPHLTQRTVVVTKSTVPVLSNKAIENEILKVNPTAQFDICSNPEFLREGSAIDDFMKPDRIVIGVRSHFADSLMKKIYAPLTQLGYPLVVTSPESAELIKYASNAFLATKIAFINEVADLAEKTGANINDIAQAVGMDSRIGPKFLQAGPGYGGSCFPKDTRAFAYMAEQNSVVSHIIQSVISSNEQRKKSMTSRIVNACGGTVKNKKLSILGVTFKANTDDMRESVALDIIPSLLELGANVHAYDPTAEHQAHEALPKTVQWQTSAIDTLENSDAMIILTEWSEFKLIDLHDAYKKMRTPLIIDLRNLLDSKNAINSGFDYYCIGQQPVKANIT